MNPLFLFLILIFFDNVYSFKPNYGVKKQSKSIFSNKKHTETITPARYKVGNKDIKYARNTADDFFPEVEYPTNIMEASKPFYFKAEENNAFVAHFADEVKANFNSALTNPVIKKVGSMIINKNEEQPKNLTPRSTVPETNSEETLDNQLLKTEQPVLTKPYLDSPLQVQLIPQSEKTTDYKIFESERMISPESESYESYEDIDATDYADTSSIENKTAKFYQDQVEVFYSDEVFFGNNSYEDRIPEDASELEFVEEYYDSSLNNSSLCSSKIEEPTVNSITSAKPDTSTLEVCPLTNEKAISETVQKAPKRLGLGPMSNVKKRKFLQQLYKPPSLFS